MIVFSVSADRESTPKGGFPGPSSADYNQAAAGGGMGNTDKCDQTNDIESRIIRAPDGHLDSILNWIVFSLTFWLCQP